MTMAETEANTSNESIDFVSKSNKKKRERERDFMEYVSEKVSAKGKDPLVECFFPNATNQLQQNEIFRSMIYYGARAPRAANPLYGTVVGALNTMLVCNGATAANPLTQRFASATQVSNWLGFLSSHSATIRGGLASPPVMIQCRMEGGAWFPYII